MIIRKTVIGDFYKIDLQDIQKDEFNTETTPLTYTFLRGNKPVAIVKLKVIGERMYIGAFIGMNITGYGLLSLIKTGKAMIRTAKIKHNVSYFSFVVKDGFVQGERLAKIMGFVYSKIQKINNTYYREYIKWQA